MAVFTPATEKGDSEKLYNPFPGFYATLATLVICVVAGIALAPEAAFVAILVGLLLLVVILWANNDLVSRILSGEFY